jgi:hypothetical protein
MANFIVSDIPVGLELLKDSETFLDDLNQESTNLVIGGHCAPSPQTPFVLCLPVGEPEPVYEPPIHRPKQKPRQRLRPIPPVKTHPVAYVD